MDELTKSKITTKKLNNKRIIKYKLDPSSSLLCEDALKFLIYKYDGKNWNKEKLAYAAPIKQSPFGDFPKNFLKGKSGELLEIDNEKHKETSLNERNRKIKENLLKSTAFTSLIKATNDKPEKSGALSKRFITPSRFRLHYDRGDLPIMINHTNGTSIAWKGGLFKKGKEHETEFDYKLFLPIFVEGIREKTDPYRFLAIQGTFFLLQYVKDAIIKVIPDLIPPLKSALNTRDPEVIAIALKVIQKLVVSSDLAGDVLVPFYRQILPIFNLYKNKNSNLGDKYEYSQRKKENLGDLIQETLEIMEQNGGDVRYIKYNI